MVRDTASSPRRRSLRTAAVLALLVTLAGCAGQFEKENTGTVTPETLALMQARDMERPAPIAIRIYKEEKVLEVWKQDQSGRYAPLKSYPICRFSGTIGPKKTEGDHQAPEGFYEVTQGQMNPHSREYLAFNLGYPNVFDRTMGRTGDSLMVHGGCRSVGCYAMTDKLVDEIYGLAYEALKGGQARIQVQAYPFKLTDANLLRHTGDPNLDFWMSLKPGSDLFEATRVPPRVEVCNQRYTFGPATLAGGTSAGSLCTGQFSRVVSKG